METLVANMFIRNWQQKLVALLTAIVMWFFVNHSIMETKIIPSVPIRVVNIPSDHTILGLMPNGILSKRITLTLTGTKDVVENLEPGDIEVVVDASIIDHNDWILRLTKNNLVSLTSTDLKKYISNVGYSEYVIKIRPLLTAQIPITMLPPKGEAPRGYEFLDVWPQKLVQTFSGAEEEIQMVKTNGLELQFDLNRISKAELDSLASNKADEITFYIPNSWKRVDIPCKTHMVEDLNDPDASDLQIDFLRKQVLPIRQEIPLRVYYPLENQKTINPELYPIALNNIVKEKNGITVFTPPLYVHDVTQEFLNIVRDNLEIVITAGLKKSGEPLPWSVEIINPHELENKYVEAIFNLHPRAQDADPERQEYRSQLYRKRFREYMQKFELYITPEQPLILEAYPEEGKINIRTVQI